MADANFRTLEERLISEIARKEREIALLQQERDALNRLLLQAKKSEVAGREAVRSSSVKRVMAEDAIIRRLRANAPSDISIEHLELVVRAIGINSPATLRSHLHRLKERGIIESVTRGRWRLVKEQE
jgi:hypothetical protein